MPVISRAVRYPFEHLADRIHHTIGAGAVGEGADRNRVERPGVVAVQEFFVPFIAPGKDAPVGTAHRLFPFEFIGQPPGLTRLFRQPGRIGLRVGNCHHGDRMVAAAFRHISSMPLEFQRPLIGMDQAVGLPSRLIDGRRLMAGLRDKAGVFGVCHQIDHDVEGTGLALGTRQFILVPFVVARDAVAVSLFVEPVGQLALITVGATYECAGWNRGDCRRLKIIGTGYAPDNGGQKQADKN